MLASESDFNFRIGNNIHQSKLKSQLERITEERRSNMKMIEASQSRFNKQYLRYKPIPPSTGSEANDIRMFITHNPGFCYSRYGKMRSTEFLPEMDQTHCFQMIREMVFTNGEVDVDKVMCLHLLVPQLIGRTLLEKRIQTTSSSKAGLTITEKERFVNHQLPILRTGELHHFLRKPSYQDATTKDIMESVSTDNSKNPSITHETIRSCSLLPSYLITSEEASKQLENIFDDNDTIYVAMHVNTQIELLVENVLDVLQEIKSEKLYEIQQLAKSPKALREMLMKPEVYQFIDSLAGNSIISSSSSFEIHAVKLMLLNTEEEPSTQFSEVEESCRTVNLLSKDSMILSNLIKEIQHSVFVNSQGENCLRPKDKSQNMKSNFCNISRTCDKEDRKLLTVPIAPTYSDTAQKELDSNYLESSVSLLKNIPNDRSNTVKNIYCKRSNNSGNSLKTLRRVFMSSSVDKTYYAKDSDFTITSYSGFTKSSGVSHEDLFLPTENLGLPSTADSKQIEEMETEVKHINLERQNTAHNDSRGLRTTLRTSKVKPIINKPQKRVKRLAPFLPTIEDAEKHLNEFKERLLKDDFLQKRGYHVGLFGSTFIPDATEKQQSLPSTLPQFYQQLSRGKNAVNESIDYLQKKFLNSMTPLQRMFVCRKLDLLKDTENNQKQREEVSFASYVVPVLSKQSIVTIVNKFREVERKVLFMPESEGGLGLPLCYLNTSKTSPTVEGSIPVTKLPNYRTVYDAKLTALDLAKLKCEIGEKEIRRKFVKFMNTPISK